jgi:hypothetical protein
MVQGGGRQVRRAKKGETSRKAERGTDTPNSRYDTSETDIGLILIQYVG